MMQRCSRGTRRCARLLTSLRARHGPVPTQDCYHPRVFFCSSGPVRLGITHDVARALASTRVAGFSVIHPTTMHHSPAPHALRNRQWLLRFAHFCAALAVLVHFSAGVDAQEIAGSIDTAFNPQIPGAVNCVAVQLDGKILVAGNFNTISGQPRSSIARLLPDGSVEPEGTFLAGTGPNGSINCMAVQRDGKIVVGGDFTMFSGQLRNRIARLLPNGGLDDTSPFLIGANGPVHSIAVQEDQRIVIGGEFTTFNNQNVNRIARLNEYGFPEGISSFNPGMAVTNGGVFSISWCCSRSAPNWSRRPTANCTSRSRAP